jgi:hypothetical protein
VAEKWTNILYEDFLDRGYSADKQLYQILVIMDYFLIQI